MVWDNRSTTLRVPTEGLSEEAASEQAIMEHFFYNSGERVEVRKDAGSSAVLVKFKNREVAEQVGVHPCNGSAVCVSVPCPAVSHATGGTCSGVEDGFRVPRT